MGRLAMGTNSATLVSDTAPAKRSDEETHLQQPCLDRSSCPAGTAHTPCQPACNIGDQENGSIGTKDRAPPAYPVGEVQSETGEEAHITHLDEVVMV